MRVVIRVVSILDLNSTSSTNNHGMRDERAKLLVEQHWLRGSGSNRCPFWFFIEIHEDVFDALVLGIGGAIGSAALSRLGGFKGFSGGQFGGSGAEGKW